MLSRTGLPGTGTGEPRIRLLIQNLVKAVSVREG